MSKNIRKNRIVSLIVAMVLLVSLGARGGDASRSLRSVEAAHRDTSLLSASSVRSSCILPSVITEDMVLTPEKLYIIPDATVIQAGVTVRAEAGTHIQFWSDDTDDADSPIACLTVKGNFLTEGTREAPVYIYPSRLMDRYGVEIGSTDTGYVSLKYTDITNFFYGEDHTGTGNRIDLADHCTFRNNYTGDIHYRSTLADEVRDTADTQGCIGNITAKDCAFYRLAFSGTTALYGSAERCAFTQCGIDFYGQYKNCVFLGNAATDPQTCYASALPLTSASGLPDARQLQVFFRPATGTTYLRFTGTAGAAAANAQTIETLAFYISRQCGGGFAVVETQEELSWLQDAGVFSAGALTAGIQKTYSGNVWSDGTAVGAFIAQSGGTYLDSGSLSPSGADRALFEIPGPILPEQITFADYAITLDTEMTYQLAPQSTPVQLGTDQFLYESSDETVLTVSNTGLVTPVSPGTADVWVYSLDRAVKNYVTVTVTAYTEPEETEPEPTEDPNAKDPSEKEDGDISIPLFSSSRAAVFSTRSGVVHESVLDETVVRILTPERFIENLESFMSQTRYNPAFTGNAILNPISTDTNVSRWLQIQAPAIADGCSQIPLGGNWWGTADEATIDLQLTDQADAEDYARLMYAPYLTAAPENTFPFVTELKLFNTAGAEVTTVGKEQITFRVRFNRDMDTSIPLQVGFGSGYPYDSYSISGAYIDPRTWEGTCTVNTFMKNGTQFLTVSNGCSATDALTLQPDLARFGFTIDTSGAQAPTIQGTATDAGIQLSWSQDDFDTLLGYNVYRSDSPGVPGQKLNTTVIPADTTEFLDDTVESGKTYYYSFTVVRTDSAETDPSGQICLVSKELYPVGDMNCDFQVTDADAVYLLRHTLFTDDYPIFQSGDVNNDGQVTDADAVYLLRHTLFPQDYPLN